MKQIKVQRWDVFELAIKGNKDKNPFVDYDIRGTFTGEKEAKTVDGFYDGDGIYRIRFMPSFTGVYNYVVKGSFSGECHSGSFEAVPPEKGNHGPVRVASKYHFAYEDGIPYYAMGTTCYAWTHQPVSMQEQTLKTLKSSPFNKIRFCIFPKHYDYNLYEPLTYPYEGTPCDSSGLSRENYQDYKPSNPGNRWDFTRFHTEHFRIIENRIADLMKLGVEADLILMHPYDRWGFSQMDEESGALYLKYVIARFSAYRNVWWSLANEYDLCEKKSIRDWEDNCATAAHPGFRNKYYLFYTGHTRPGFKEFGFEPGKSYRVEVIDTWDMTIEDRGIYKGKFKVDLPGREYMGVRITEVNQTALRDILKKYKQYGIKPGREYLIISRGDSTLRGHYPLETDTLKQVLEEDGGKKTDAEILFPFFQEGGRLTAENIHYVNYDGTLIPVGDTEFAGDKTFGFANSDLCKYLEEKTGGKYAAESVTSTSLHSLRNLDFDTIAGQLMGVKDYRRYTCDMQWV